ncbi:MBL fold metallo-hydrolase [Aurantimonas sp. VKM B-3413]|uniref:MBL fold metallo-hydrolase n=1 Tax=Aurantimonas sp. VKM B-3413 TaxID=2779401 RepID=UPI001E5DF910|nr:MBL fold metallo-hydrolase [Aurantimonas sp. VKM B-3413]MCB8837813.1 MBL fold metallo-hydrolase [Aurantimonas sp. VKM B-3413]
MLKTVAAILFAAALLAPVAARAQPVPSTCLAVAESLPGAIYADFSADRAGRDVAPRLAALNDTVTITYVAHSTYLIESPAGVVAATDFAGYASGALPDIVTMNKAHSSHNTPYPDPAIANVLRGWNPDGPGPARHALTVGDMYVRNVTTDIRSFGGSYAGAMEHDGNSIFIFEVAGLCIGHLGHLHHALTNSHYAQIGRLDVLMVPVDGGYTLSQGGMGETAKRLRAQIVLPMHRFAGPIERFLDRLPDFAVERRATPSLTVSVRTLPERPTVIVLKGV